MTMTMTMTTMMATTVVAGSQIYRRRRSRPRPSPAKGPAHAAPEWRRRNWRQQPATAAHSHAHPQDTHEHAGAAHTNPGAIRAGALLPYAERLGQRLPKQQVNYVIAAQNIRAEGDMRNLRIRSMMPANLEVVSASASYGIDPALKSVDAVVAGNEVSLKLDTLKPGEQVFIAIQTRVKEGATVGSQIVSQAELTFTDIRSMAFSNFVSVLVVGAPPTAQVSLAQAQITPTTTTRPPSPTTAASATPGASPSATSAPSPSPTNAPSPSPTKAAAGGVKPPTSVPLPETSTGVPIFGFAMLGMTMMLRTIRIHRAQSRI